MKVNDIGSQHMDYSTDQEPESNQKCGVAGGRGRAAQRM